jgi:glycosyltransferase involved in cell wall biosynthesis
VITTQANGAAEFINPRENGEIIAHPDDIESWGKFLDEWLAWSQDPQVGRRAQEAVAHLSWENTVSQTLEVLAEAAASL